MSNATPQWPKDFQIPTAARCDDAETQHLIDRQAESRAPGYVRTGDTLVMSDEVGHVLVYRLHGQSVKVPS